MKHKFSLAEETILTTLVYMVLGIAAIPIGIIYAAALAAGYNSELTLLVFLGISVPCAWFIRPRVERWLLRRLFVLQSPNTATSDCKTVIIRPSNARIALVAAASFSSLALTFNTLDTVSIQELPVREHATIGSESNFVLNF